MSISGAFNAALSGLSFASRSANVVSNNIANATTEGYGARRVIASTLVAGGDVMGVRVASIERSTDAVLIGQRRSADAEAGQANIRSNFLTELEAVYGTPDATGSLGELLDRFEGSLITASNRPDSVPALSSVAYAAGDLVSKINHISKSIQTQRENADQSIGHHINVMNDSLKNLEALNKQLLAERGRGGNINGILDQQQVIIDSISDLVPLREYRAQNGTLRIYSQDGIPLLDGSPSVLEFEPNSVITPDMTLSSAALSEVTINGHALPANGSQMGLSGGRLAALFELRDETAVSAQAELDAFARNLIERFESPGIDPTRVATDPALFSDGGSPADPANEVGLAQRLEFNTLVDPHRGGDVTKLRDGLGSIAPGLVGNSSVLNGFLAAFSDDVIIQSGSQSGQAKSLSQFASDVLSVIGSSKHESVRQQAFTTSRLQTLEHAEASQGVNTDEELQNMLLVEKLYTANARVIQTASDMLDTLMRIGA